MQKHWGIFLGMLKKVRIFLGIKYEPLSDPPVIKICEWGPWGSPLFLDQGEVRRAEKNFFSVHAAYVDVPSAEPLY